MMTVHTEKSGGMDHEDQPGLLPLPAADGAVAAVSRQASMDLRSLPAVYPEFN